MYHETVDIGSRQISRYSVAGVVLSAYDLAECNLDVSILFLNQTLKIHSRTKISYSSFLAKDKHKFSWVNSSATYSTLKMDIILYLPYFSFRQWLDIRAWSFWMFMRLNWSLRLSTMKMPPWNPSWEDSIRSTRSWLIDHGLSKNII